MKKWLKTILVQILKTFLAFYLWVILQKSRQGGKFLSKFSILLLAIDGPY